MDEELRTTFEILMWPLGAGLVGCGPEGSRIHFVRTVMLHIKSKVMKSKIQWCKHFAPAACLGFTRGLKLGFWVLFFFYCVPTLLRLLYPTTQKWRGIMVSCWLSVCPSVCFRFWIITWVNINGFSSNLVCALILWRSGLGLLMG